MLTGCYKLQTKRKYNLYRTKCFYYKFSQWMTETCKCVCSICPAVSFTFLFTEFISEAPWCPLLSQLLAFSVGLKRWQGGPIMLISIKDDRLLNSILFRFLVRMVFMTLQALSHSAALTGSESRPDLMHVKVESSFRPIVAVYFLNEDSTFC